MIKLSIIIPSYNQGQYLEDALTSILSQKTNEIEIIVMDGGSTDQSVEIIKKYEKHITFWQSQKDNGQSDAINQGFRKASGEYVTWLNSDDVLLSGALNAILSEIGKYPEYNWFLGNVLWLDKEGKIIKVGKVEKECWFWNKRYLFSNGGPTAIMKREYLLEIGALREDFHYMMDTELWYRYIKLGNPFRRIRTYCWGLRLHEQAKMSGHNFADSPLADKKHPSWEKKQSEKEYIDINFPKTKRAKTCWRICKLLMPTFYTRYTCKSLLGKNYLEII